MEKLVKALSGVGKGLLKKPSNDVEFQIIQVPISTKTLLEFLPEMLKKEEEIAKEMLSEMLKKEEVKKEPI